MLNRTKKFIERFCLTGLQAGAVGLALSYAVTLMGMFQWGVRQSAEVENMVRTSFTILLNHCSRPLFTAQLTFIALMMFFLR